MSCQSPEISAKTDNYLILLWPPRFVYRHGIVSWGIEQIHISPCSNEIIFSEIFQMVREIWLVEIWSYVTYPMICRSGCKITFFSSIKGTSLQWFIVDEQLIDPYIYLDIAAAPLRSYFDKKIILLWVRNVFEMVRCLSNRLSGLWVLVRKPNLNFVKLSIL